MKRHAIILLGGLCWLTAGFGAGRLDPAPDGARADSVKVPASHRYHKPGLLRRVFIGSNYRKVWGTPVSMPVFDLSATSMKIVELGGGQQTKSLRLKGKNGKEWVLRTVDKDVTLAMPEKLRNTLAQSVVQDLISAANPYAPLVVAHLAKTLGVPAPDPTLYFVPDDPAFGQYQKIFANRICYLEQRDPTFDGSESENSAHLQKQLAGNSEVQVLQTEVLQARLLDMLIADWDRHADQWRWGVLDSAKAKWYYAIPRDRDQAFFHAGGIIPRVGKAVAMQHLNWFKKDMRGLNKLNFKSRAFDRIYLNDLDRSEWEQGILKFKAALTDEVIDAAVARFPAPVYQQVGKEIASLLKSRRDDMLQPVLRYYQNLAREVQVWGSREAELFELADEDGDLLVKVWALNKEGKPHLLRYERRFDRKATKLLHLESLGGADHFLVRSLPAKMPEVHLYSSGAGTRIEVPEKLLRKLHIHTDADTSVPAEVAAAKN